jgi:hypothetical protein
VIPKQLIGEEMDDLEWVLKQAVTVDVFTVICMVLELYSMFTANSDILGARSVSLFRIHE